MRTYSFFDQLAIGEAHEQHLDAHFRRALRLNRIVDATRSQQTAGIDRIWHTESGAIVTVEYKADDKAGHTGNAFIETVSVDTANKPGWAVASAAQLLAYMVTDPQTIYLVEMVKLRAELPRWRQQYRTASAQNDGYRIIGILVPLDELERIAARVW